MSKKVMIFLLSLVISAYASPVVGMGSSASRGTQTASSGKAIPLSTSEISHYQQMQAMAEAKGLLSLQGGGPVTDEMAMVIIAVAAAAIVGVGGVQGVNGADVSIDEGIRVLNIRLRYYLFLLFLFNLLFSRFSLACR